VEVLRASEAERHGIGQWTYLPLHRTRTYEVRVVARSVTLCTVQLRLGSLDRPDLQAAVEIGLDDAWQSHTGTLVLPEGAPADGLYELSLTSSAPAHFVLDRVLLTPDDAVDGADPDVIRMLREAHLPLLRWPGGNFVSGYHWRDGVGPLDERPTLPNPAWEGLEFNLFGTDEFIAFCRAVGCEPMICVNAGNGTPEEAAAWVEYCNGGPDTEMGKLRAAHGHPEPYNVRLWEIGNEIYGHWQVGWTTPDGNVDRYRRFREAIMAVDPTVQTIGCGYGNVPDSEWNRRLIEGAAETLQTITDHILTGGGVDAQTDPIELVHAFLGYPMVLEERYRDLEQRMRAAGITSPHLAITELQLFAHFYGAWSPDDALTPAKMPRPDTITEALYLTEIVNSCARLGDFVSLLTHSATVNHGGGLRKERERVYANPVHHAHALGHALAGGTPVAVQLACAGFSTHRDFAHVPPMDSVPLIDTLAVLSETGDLLLSLVHRGAAGGPIDLEIALEGYRAQPQAEVTTLAGETWYDRNSREAPERVVPRHTQLSLSSEDRFAVTLAPFSITQVRLRTADE
jgi:alpha-N-arabinofuranosidase